MNTPLIVPIKTKKGVFCFMKWSSEELDDLFNLLPDSHRYQYLFFISPTRATETYHTDLIIHSYLGWNGMCYTNYLSNKLVFSTAIESFNSLLEKHRIYLKNPINKPVLFVGDKLNSAEYRKWNEAEQRTGTWAIFKLIE